MAYFSESPSWYRLTHLSDWKSNPEDETIWSEPIEAWNPEAAAEKFIESGDPYFDGETDTFVVMLVTGGQKKILGTVDMSAYLIMDYKFEFDDEHPCA